MKTIFLIITLIYISNGVVCQLPNCVLDYGFGACKCKLASVRTMFDMECAESVGALRPFPNMSLFVRSKNCNNEHVVRLHEIERFAHFVWAAALITRLAQGRLV